MRARLERLQRETSRGIIATPRAGHAALVVENIGRDEDGNPIEILFGALCKSVARNAGLESLRT